MILRKKQMALLLLYSLAVHGPGSTLQQNVMYPSADHDFAARLLQSADGSDLYQ